MPLPLAVQPAKFEELVPGSKIRLAHVRGDFDTTEGLVIAQHDEAGTFHLPAIDYLPNDASETTRVYQNGDWLVEFILDARKIRDIAGSGQLPSSGFSAEPKTSEVVGAVFDGSPDNAGEIVRWAVGVAVITFEPPSGLLPARLLVRRPDRQEIAEPGDFLVHEADGIVVYTDEQFDERYTRLGE